MVMIGWIWGFTNLTSIQVSISAGYELKNEELETKLFLPASGYCSENKIYNKGIGGYYWSDEPITDDSEYLDVISLTFNNFMFGTQRSGKYKGTSIRPIAEIDEVIFYNMKKLFTLITMLCALTACSSLEEENFGTGTGKTAKVSFNVGGEISTEYESITRAGSPVYEIFIDEKTADNAVTPYLHGTFSTLDGVVAELPVGKEYLFAIQYAPVGSATGQFATPSSTEAITYNSAKGYTHYSYTASYLQENVYYGETVENITATGAQTVSITALYCDFGLKFNVTQPLNGTLTVTSTEPAFTYTYSADGVSTFPEGVVCYTMKHPWAEDESITLTVTYSEDNYTKEVIVTPKRNKAAKLNINLNPATAALSFSCTLEDIDLSEEVIDIDREEETGIPYVTFHAEEEQTLRTILYGEYDVVDPCPIEGLEYSLNGGEWELLGKKSITFGGNNGDLQLRGSNGIGTSGFDGWNVGGLSSNGHYGIKFGTSTKVKCSGDIRTLADYENYLTDDTSDDNFGYLFYKCTSLTSAPELPATSLASGCYAGMFSECTSLTSAPELPATSLAYYCYDAMFYKCTSLTSAPELPATSLAFRCYAGMFSECTSLTSAPELPATSLASGCYKNMFSKCTSLTSAPELPATTLASNCYESMFASCTSLTTAPELPATSLASSCYSYMFGSCTSLISAPELPATSLASGCYEFMFDDCTSLTSAPELPATSLASDCYRYMFRNCTSLTSAPELPATSLASGCYEFMFYKCTSLNYVKMMATDISANSCLEKWLYEVSPSGVFVKNNAATWEKTGSSGIPTNWTVETAQE